ncbi:MAG: hypothetical protein K1X89_06100 [Myxococcaceae bacterium]|nr:hypothetical protein [Myxococcaceae bacterium]
MKPSAIAAVLVLFTSGAYAQAPCETPRARNTAALSEAIAQDDAMAQTFERTAAACASVGDACEQAKVRCSEQLAATLQRQVGFDDGAYLRDMLVPFQGQTYRMAAGVTQGTMLTDVSCNAEPSTLGLVAGRRKAQAERRRALLAEYPRWLKWTQDEARRCQELAAAAKAQDSARSSDATKAAAATAAAAAAAAAAAKVAEDQRLAAAKDKLDAETRAKLDAEAAAKAAEERAAKQLEAEKQARLDAEDRARREKEDAEEKAKREQLTAEERAAVEEREQKKAEARARKAELEEKEKQRREQAKRDFEAKQRAAADEHQRKLEQLKMSVGLTEDQRAAQLAEEQRQFDEAERLRQEQANKEISGIEVDVSDERQRGTLAGHGAAAYFGLGSGSGAMVGGQFILRHGFFGTAPASGLAWGLELRGSALILTSVGSATAASLISLAPEVRYWFGRLGLGVAFEWSRFGDTPVGLSPQTKITQGIGPTLSLAAWDGPSSRLVLAVKWLPVVSNQLDRVLGEAELGFGWLSITVQAGLLRDDSNLSTVRSGWYVGAGVGPRIRW